MLRNLLFQILISFSISLYAQEGVVQGRVLDAKGNYAAFATVLLYQGEEIKNGATTDDFGLYTIKPVEAGVYSVKAMITEEEEAIIENVVVKQGDTAKLDIALLITGKTDVIDKVEIICFKEPLMASGCSVGASVSGSSFKQNGIRDVSSISTVVAGVYNTKKRRGNQYIVDGVKVRGNPNLPSNRKSTKPAKDLQPLLEEPSRANLLTATEVNDLKKWTQWEDFTKEEFKGFVDNWTFQPRERYTVQLSTNSFQPVVDELVDLLDEQGKLLWRARTDNTGKAELWGGFFVEEDFVNRNLEIKGKDFSLSTPQPFSKGINHIQVNRACELPKAIDISFVVDASGSMGDELDFLKAEVKGILEHIQAEYGEKAFVRASTVFYRDEKEALSTLDFGSDFQSIADFIETQTISGGDEPMYEALEAAVNFDWSKTAKTRLVFLIGDEAPHIRYNTQMANISKKAAEKGIKIIPIACSGTDRSLEYLFRAIALSSNGTYFSLTDDSGIGDKHLAPLTDKQEIELLSDAIKRVILQYSFIPECNKSIKSQEEDIFAHSLTPKKQLKLYPNPCQGLFTMEYKFEDLKELYLTDYTGKILEKIPFYTKETTQEYNISQYPSGIYLLHYVNEKGVAGTEKLILQH